MKHIKLFVFGYLIGVVISFLAIFFADPKVIDVEHQHATMLLQILKYGFRYVNVPEFIGSIFGYALIPFIVLEVIFRKK